MRSGTSVGANYRSSGRAKSKAHFISKLGDVEEELDETMFWMELLAESGTVPTEGIMEPMKEAAELLSIVVASIQRAKGNR